MAGHGSIRPFCRVAALLALAVASCAADQPSPNSGGAVDIQVVRTWRELMDQPAIKVGDATARLGVEKLEGPCKSAVLLYCLTDGFDIATFRHGTSLNEQLGPFTVAVLQEGEPPYPFRKIRENVTTQDAGRGTMLFRTAVLMPFPDKYRVIVLSADERAVAASVVITATAEEDHPWMPFTPTLEAPYAAVPSPNGAILHIFQGEFKGRQIVGNKSERLPALFPAEAGSDHGSLRVRAEGRELIVEAGEDILVSRPELHFLARWWVNGRPYVPDLAHRTSRDIYENGPAPAGKNLRLRLAFDRAVIGANPGDKIEAQLLYCRDGWDFVTSQQDKPVVLSDWVSEGPELLISNRVELPAGAW